jgi:hypothetical protein
MSLLRYQPIFRSQKRDTKLDRRPRRIEASASLVPLREWSDSGSVEEFRQIRDKELSRK